MYQKEQTLWRTHVISCASTIEGPFAVIGDVHGYMPPLENLLEILKANADDYNNRWLVFVGDLVDRGKNPRRAVELVIELIKNRGRTTCIMGNHEFALLCALGLLGPTLEQEYADFYVEEFDPEPTFESYGVEFGNLKELREAMTQEHLDFLLGLPWRVEAEGHLIVHAGLLPDMPYEEQLEKLRNREMNPGQPWIHEQRLVTAQLPPDCPVTVVSGHVRFPEVVMTEKRILLDTTGGRDGRLSGVLLPERRVFTSEVLI
jgi:serine/threonine protein phosphatase 1